MTECKINFTQESDPLAYGIYQDLLGIGVSCGELDYGYNVTNYAGLYCPDKNARSCVKGKGDGVVEADEVKEYVLDKEYETDPQKYEQFRRITEGRLGEPLPWVLDDLDPNTKDDNDIREKVIQPAIDELKRIILAKGITENSGKYNEMMAAGLTWFVAVPDKATIKKIWQSSYYWQMMIDRIEDDGLGEFVGYLKANGGIRVEGDNSKEFTALEALNHKEGECTEISKILFAAMKMAGLRPVFIEEDLLKEERNDPIIKEAIKGTPMGKMFLHLCIGLYIDGRVRFFDPSTINSDTNYKHYTPLSLRQYLSLDYSNRGMAWEGKGELDKAIADYTRAIEIDSKYATIYYNRGKVWKTKGALDEAIADYTRAIEIDPKYALVWNNLGLAWETKGKLDKAMACYTRAIESDSKFALAYINRGILKLLIVDFKSAITDLSTGLKLTNADFNSLVNGLAEALGPLWQKDGNKEIADTFTRETGALISGVEAHIILSYALWQNGSKEDAIERLRNVVKYITVKAMPSKSTRKFLTNILGAMPKNMKKDKGVQEILRSLREKMK